MMELNVNVMKLEDLNTTNIGQQRFKTQRSAWKAVEAVFGEDGGYGSGYEIHVFQDSRGWFVTFERDW